MNRRLVLLAVSTVLPLSGCLRVLPHSSERASGDVLDLSIANKTARSHEIAVSVQPTEKSEPTFSETIPLESGKTLHYTTIDAMGSECLIIITVSDERTAEYRFVGDTPGSHKGVEVTVKSKSIEFNTRG
ncbi:hypothetical protein [Halomarina litorea]|uniref:hypothetical protein n=1 Tax=Halomarina litorea TaxID=2961595 RepID=UPI0020C20A6F|nr:hypothetical protein [Halomarina sp. BCD28]